MLELRNLSQQLYKGEHRQNMTTYHYTIALMHSSNTDSISSHYSCCVILGYNEDICNHLLIILCN